MIVDDEKDMGMLIQQKFRKQIKSGEFEFILAYNGLEALAKIIEHPEISLILSDINMPEMDGLTLLTKLKELNNPSLKTVIVSAYGDMDNIRTAMNQGAFDFVTKPVDFQDLEKTIYKTIEELNVLRNALKEHNKLISIERDLSVAREIQLAILPKNFPAFPERADFEIFAIMEAAKEVGGDFYDFFLIDDNHLGLVIADVSGKGVPAAIFMAVSRTLIRATGLRGMNPAMCFNYVNNLLCNESISSMFVTVFYGILDLESGKLVFTNAGHNHPFILTSEGEVTKLNLPEGLVMGIIENIEFENSEIILNKGDKIFLYTDGVTEAFDKNQNLYSEDKLKYNLNEFALLEVNGICNNIVKSVHNFSADVPQSDDVTVLALKYSGKQ